MSDNLYQWFQSQFPEDRAKPALIHPDGSILSYAELDQKTARLAGWLGDGRLKYREDVVDGIENAPGALIGLLQGENFGKRIVKVAEATMVGDFD